MKTFKLIIEYDGTRYSGWAEQKNAKTVMGELRFAAERFFEGRVELMGAGRTDAGVHASAQVAHLRVDLQRKVRAEDVARGINEELPVDIAIREVRDAPPTFHARHDALSRTYVYRISRRKTAFWKKFLWWIKEPLDVTIMMKAAAKLAGRHDFVCFRAIDPSKPNDSTIVVVESASIEEKDDLILFRIEASHFLWRMVRRLAGTLVKLGKGEITMEEFDQLLAGKSDPRLDVAAWTAPAAGLFLERVHYPVKTK